MKGSLTIEAAVVIPVYLFTMVAALQIGIGFYCEIRDEQQEVTLQELWLVHDFYKYQAWKGTRDD